MSGVGVPRGDREEATCTFPSGGKESSPGKRAAQATTERANPDNQPSNQIGRRLNRLTGCIGGTSRTSTLAPRADRSGGRDRPAVAQRHPPR
jgi:hypothetical protein